MAVQFNGVLVELILPTLQTGQLISFLGSMIRSSKPEGSEYVVLQKHDKHCNECLYRSNDCCCIFFSVLYRKNGTNSFFSISDALDESAIFISLMLFLCSNSNIIKSKHAISLKSMHNLHISI